MARPEYVNGGTQPSVETWEEACAISQEWADGARRAADKRRQWMHWTVLMLLMIMVAIAGALVLIFVVKP